MFVSLLIVPKTQRTERKSSRRHSAWTRFFFATMSQCIQQGCCVPPPPPPSKKPFWPVHNTHLYSLKYPTGSTLFLCILTNEGRKKVSQKILTTFWQWVLGNSRPSFRCAKEKYLCRKKKRSLQRIGMETYDSGLLVLFVWLTGNL